MEMTHTNIVDGREMMREGFRLKAEGRSAGAFETELESLLTSLLVKELRQTAGQGLFADDQADTLGGLFDMTLGQFLAEQGGLGLSRGMSLKPKA